MSASWLSHTGGGQWGITTNKPDNDTNAFVPLFLLSHIVKLFNTWKYFASELQVLASVPVYAKKKGLQIQNNKTTRQRREVCIGTPAKTSSSCLSVHSLLMAKSWFILRSIEKRYLSLAEKKRSGDVLEINQTFSRLLFVVCAACHVQMFACHKQAGTEISPVHVSLFRNIDTLWVYL